MVTKTRIVPAAKKARAKVTPVAAAAEKATGRVRVSLKAAEGGEIKPGGSYFANSDQRTGLEFVSTGCTLLDQVLGGGYALGRMSNIIGDKSTGKTLLAIEAVVNFCRKFPDGAVRYLEAESAFDKGYAEALGLPLDRVSWADMVDKKGESDRTVEWWYEDLVKFLDDLNGKPGVYIVDSLDALSDRGEIARDISDGSFGGQKPKKIGELFRRLVGRIEESRVLVLVISQIRDKIGVTFGETKMRTGGRAMDFYATHCLWLAQIKTLTRTVAKIDRATGVMIRAKAKKNKIGLPFRECDFPLLFGYGVDDVTAAVEWLVAAGKQDRLTEVDMSVAGYKMRIQNLRNKGGAEMAEVRRRLSEIVVAEWSAIEQSFLPTAGKY